MGWQLDAIAVDMQRVENELEQTGEARGKMLHESEALVESEEVCDHAAACAGGGRRASGASDDALAARRWQDLYTMMHLHVFRWCGWQWCVGDAGGWDGTGYDEDV